MKLTITSRHLAVIAAVYFTVFLNMAFWRTAWGRMEVKDWRDGIFLASMPVTFFIVTYVVFELILWPRVAKPLLVFLLILSSAANYFMFELGIFIDSGMMRNVFATNPQEAGEMVTLRGLLWVLVLGVSPAVLLLMTTIRHGTWKRELAGRAKGILTGCLVIALMAAGLHGDYRKHLKDHRVMSKLVNPANYIVSGIKCIDHWVAYGNEIVVVDPDPFHNPFEDPHHTVLVIVIGETARSMNFSLNGYERLTNPKLTGQDVISFPNVTASNTYTDFALPCLFSHLSRADFDPVAAINSEGLLDVMARAGYDIVWYDNYGGSKGASDRVPTIDLRETAGPEYRNGDFNYDEALLEPLERKLRDIKDDTVIVLHMMGSHGPRYYRRYPPEFRVFTPTADTSDIQNRPREEVVNAYDNTILYTDHVLSEAIDLLRQYPNYEAGLVYISDHGESLGENGMYLHSAPYEIAPPEQLLVPLILWMSESMQKYDHVDYKKLKAAAPEMVLSHDNFFHSILSLVEIETELYDKNLDLFKNYRTAEPPRRIE